MTLATSQPGNGKEIGRTANPPLAMAARITRMALMACVVAAVASVPLQAQRASANKLAQVKALKCTFPVYSSGSWKPAPQVNIRNGEVNLSFDEIDAQDGTARTVNAVGAAHIVAQLAAWSLHLMETSVTGTLEVTTIFTQETGPKKYKAVHTKHDYLPLDIPGIPPSEPTVSQAYGECEVVE